MGIYKALQASPVVSSQIHSKCEVIFLEIINYRERVNLEKHSKNTHEKKYTKYHFLFLIITDVTLQLKMTGKLMYVLLSLF